MPQMSPMDWFFLMIFFIFIYMLYLMLIYFLMKIYLKNTLMIKKINNFFLKWY